MNWLIDTLRRFASYLESFKKPPVYAHAIELQMLNEKVDIQDKHFAAVVLAQNEEIVKLRAEVEKLSLRIGLGRSIPTIARRP